MNKAVYQARLEKAAAHFRAIKTPETKAKADSPRNKELVRKATVAAINEQLAYLGKDLTELLKVGVDVNAEVDEAFIYAGSAVRRILGMAAIKSKTAGWVANVMTELQV